MSALPLLIASVWPRGVPPQSSSLATQLLVGALSVAFWALLLVWIARLHRDKDRDDPDGDDGITTDAERHKVLAFRDVREMKPRVDRVSAR